MRMILALGLALTLAAAARAELKPQEVAILSVAGSDQSRQLAEHYAQARGVPASQILALDIAPAETLSRADYDAKVRPAVLAWLDQEGRREKIRCFVSCWDMPLRVAARDNESPAVKRRAAELRATRARLVGLLQATLAKFDSVAADANPSKRDSLDAEAPMSDLSKACDTAMREAQLRLNGLADAEERAKANVLFESALNEAAGLSGVLQAVGDASRLPLEAAKKVEAVRGVIEGLRAGSQSLANLPDSVARDTQMWRLLLKSNGRIGAIQWVDLALDELARNETAAAFDSELTMILWPEYPLFSSQVNGLNWRVEKLAVLPPKTFMTARLEAPTFELAKKLIDTAIEVEKAGLQGKVYLDARGMAYDAKRDLPGSLGQYDQSLRELAERIKKGGRLEVTLDDKPELFAKDACPDAALYCGWSSPARYVDAFTWKPGAVAYHIAGAEAETIRTPDSRLWCGAMIERGVCATLGPCFEPNTGAFPPPDEFFSLLLTGHYTLAEAYFRTLPANSWAMVLVGDPLYNPFKNKPALDESDLPERLRADY